VGTVGCQRSYSIQLGKELRPRIVRKALMRQVRENIFFGVPGGRETKPGQWQFRDEIIRHGTLCTFRIGGRRYERRVANLSP
jgi:hypothetical protein